MKNRPFFTICIPTYNSVNICEKSINSALNQTFHDFNVLIIDDCSIDGTIDVVKRYKDYDNVKVVINKRNLGITANWRKCYKMANGKYVAFIHHDDRITKSYLFNSYDILYNNNNIGILSHINDSVSYYPNQLIDSKVYFRYIYSLKYVPPPSATILINTQRVNYDLNMKYCPEADLYLQLMTFEYKSYHLISDDVIRDNWEGRFTNKVMFSELPYNDRIYLLNKWKYHNWLDNKLRYNALFNVMKIYNNKIVINSLRLRNYSPLLGIHKKILSIYNLFNNYLGIKQITNLYIDVYYNLASVLFRKALRFLSNAKNVR